MRYTVLLEKSEEGFAESVAGLPGCHSQGQTEAGCPNGPDRADG
jgi:predicted RNase H-like HicB family nuclease